MSWKDPVDLLELRGEIVQSLPCPYMVQTGKRGSRVVGEPCGAQAVLLRFPDPYGYRARCEEGHVVVLAATQIPGLYHRGLKGTTD